MRIFFSNRASRQFSKLPKEAQQRITEKLDFITGQSNPMAFAEKLKDYELGDFRFRIGTYRVVFDLENNSINILRVGHRKDIYR